MNCMSHSVKKDHDSGIWFESEIREGVRYRIARISVARRIELARKIREIGRRIEFLEAGSDPREKLEAAVLEAEIDQAYVEWGLEDVEGLSIDGQAATPSKHHVCARRRAVGRLVAWRRRPDGQEGPPLAIRCRPSLPDARLHLWFAAAVNGAVREGRTAP